MPEELNISDSRKKTIVIVSSVFAAILISIIVLVISLGSDSDNEKSNLANGNLKRVVQATSTSSLKRVTTTTDGSTSTTATTTGKSTTSTAKTIHIMPYVQCESLVDAQSKIKAAGIDSIETRDATDAGRKPEFNNEWVVVTQTPSPGTDFEDGDVLLEAVPYDELDGGCE